MTKKLFFVGILIFSFCLFGLIAIRIGRNGNLSPKTEYWQVRSIDTMKYSRDLAREYLTSESANSVINAQVAKIASTGANYVAIGTPYDKEFLPIMKLWVAAARRNNLNVWFRGNWSGWENWFEYKSITPEEHIQNTKVFIKDNPDLFKNGDIFTACTECENGQIGDPRLTGKVEEYRDFLIELNNTAVEAFGEIDKQVYANFYSMNGDVARLVMDKPTTAALGGIVTIDHYVASPEQLNNDIDWIAASSGGKVMLGEVGVTIPDIHGTMSNDQKVAWLDELLNLLSSNDNLVGVNYWVSVGGSTALWDSKLNDSELGLTLSKYYSSEKVNIIRESL